MFPDKGEIKKGKGLGNVRKHTKNKKRYFSDFFP